MPVTLLLSETNNIHPELSRKIGDSEHNEANFKQSGTAMNEQCIMPTK